MGGTMDLSLDLSDLDTTSVSWSNGDEAAGLYALAPAGGIAVADGSGNGRGGCSSGGCGGRPIQWCCVNCH